MSKILWFFLRVICTVIRWLAPVGPYIVRSLWVDEIGNMRKVGSACTITAKAQLIVSVYVEDVKMVGRKERLVPIWRTSRTHIELEDLTHLLNRVS